MTDSPDSPDQRAVESESTPRASQRRWKLRLTLSLLVGIVMTAVPLISGWISIRDQGPGVGVTRDLWHELQQYEHAIADFRGQHQRPPESIDELLANYGASESVRPNDPWGYPYWLERTGDEFRVGTHGRDGRPGGFGLDATLTTDDRFPPEAWLTLWQYLFEIDSTGVWFCSLFSGLLIAVLVWRELRPDQWSVWNGLGLLVVLGVWAALSSFAAMVIAALELIPNGH